MGSSWRERGRYQATTQEATRDSGKSARLARMIGTSSPTTIPGQVRATRVFQLLGEHIARFEVGYQQNVGLSEDRRLQRFTGQPLLKLKEPSVNPTALGHLAGYQMTS